MKKMLQQIDSISKGIETANSILEIKSIIAEMENSLTAEHISPGKGKETRTWKEITWHPVRDMKTKRIKEKGQSLRDVWNTSERTDIRTAGGEERKGSRKDIWRSSGLKPYASRFDEKH